MTEKQYKIRYYSKVSGEEPVKDFVEKLSVKSQQKFYAKACVLLKALGPKVPMPHAKPLGNGIYELRIQHGSDTFRVVYFFYNEYAVLTNAFKKKTTKTPKEELDLARKRRKEILEEIRRKEIKL